MAAQHPLETELNASAWDIMSAIRRGFRAMVDVKGKLAEYFVEQELAKLQRAGILSAYSWFDVDGKPDFELVYADRTLRMECKNLRSGEGFKRPEPAWRVEIQRTRNSKDGTPTRAYRCSEFEILAVCLFNQTKRWEFRYASTAKLARRPQSPDLLAIMQRVPQAVEEPWSLSLEHVLRSLNT